MLQPLLLPPPPPSPPAAAAGAVAWWGASGHGAAAGGGGGSGGNGGNSGGGGNAFAHPLPHASSFPGALHAALHPAAPPPPLSPHLLKSASWPPNVGDFASSVAPPAYHDGAPAEEEDGVLWDGCGEGEGAAQGDGGHARGAHRHAAGDDPGGWAGWGRV